MEENTYDNGLGPIDPAVYKVDLYCISPSLINPTKEIQQTRDQRDRKGWSTQRPVMGSSFTDHEMRKNISSLPVNAMISDRPLRKEKKDSVQPIILDGKFSEVATVSELEPKMITNPF